jgi:hypothetical protein
VIHDQSPRQSPREELRDVGEGLIALREHATKEVATAHSEGAVIRQE